MEAELDIIVIHFVDLEGGCRIIPYRIIISCVTSDNTTNHIINKKNGVFIVLQYFMLGTHSGMVIR